MIKKDICKKYLAHDGMVRVFVIDATNMVQKLRDLHELSNVATAALGRTLMASTMISYMLKENSYRLTVNIKGDGPLGNIVVCGNSLLKMKACVTNPKVELPLNKIGKLDVASAIGKGYINIIKDIGLDKPYIGMSELITSEIAEDFAYYFNISEQTPSAVSLGVLIGEDKKVKRASGYIIQPLPDCSHDILDLIENINLNISSVTSLVEDICDLDDVAKTITGDNSIKFLDEKEPLFECDCNIDRIEKTIIALGKKDATEALENNNGILELKCHFCNKLYSFDKDKLEKLFSVK